MLENEVRYYELLPSEPPEKRPTTTKTFKDFKILAFSALLAQAIIRARRRYLHLRAGKP